MHCERAFLAGRGGKCANLIMASLNSMNMIFENGIRIYYIPNLWKVYIHDKNILFLSLVSIVQRCISLTHIGIILLLVLYFRTLVVLSSRIRYAVKKLLFKNLK